MSKNIKLWSGVTAVLAAAVLSAPLVASPAVAAGAAPTMTAHRIGTATLTAASGTGELRPPSADDIATTRRAVANRSPRSRSKATRITPALSGVTGTSVRAVGGAPTTSVLGINHYDQRTADDGNQYSLTPPDQALCASETSVVESVNNAIRVYDTAGAPLTGTVALNPFFGFSHENDRTKSPAVASPHQIGDPSCVYDAGTDRFYLTVYDLSSDASGNALGPSAIDIAVSPAGSALGAWTTYSFDTSDNGGTSCPCFSDFPHLATDATALYITTNEFPTLADGFNGAQVFALPKAALVARETTIRMAHASTASDGPGRGFTLSPVVTAGTEYPPTGSMYFLSSDNAFEDSGASTTLYLWTLNGTSTIGSGNPAITLTPKAVTVPKYAAPPLTQQPEGVTPLRDCLNVTACAKTLLGTPNRYKEVLESYDSSDGRVMQTAWSGGKVWGALDTAVDVDGAPRPGVAYYAITPGASTPEVAKTLVLPGGSLSYPALGMTASGTGVIGLSLAGAGYHPSAAYAVISSGAAPTTVTVAAAGKGPYDDFSGYRAYEYNRPRFGDYGAASVVGDKVWLASEYIDSSGCSAATFQATSFTCGDASRTALANWATRISAVTVS